MEVRNNLGAELSNGLHSHVTLIKGAAEKNVSNSQALHALQIADALLRPADYERLLQLLRAESPVAVFEQMLSLLASYFEGL